LLTAAARRGIEPLDALRLGIDALALEQKRLREPLDAAVAIVAAGSVLTAAYWRLLNGKELISPRSGLSFAANYLYMLTGRVPSDAETRALSTYLSTVADHGLNASTFTARVITSTASDMVSAVVGAIGALKGPLHGGAPGPALDVVFDIQRQGDAEGYLRRKIEAGERFMGFGHRVYKVRDPRADVLEAAAEALYRNGGDMALFELARSVEATALRLLEEYKPGRHLRTNVEFFTALLLHGLGLPTALFTPTFAIARAGGWTAHCLEQAAQNRLIRPQSEYIGERDRAWQELSVG
jgi:citrate synthase